MRSALALTPAIAWTAPALAPIVPAVAAALRVPLRHAGDTPLLTFDDGPHPEGTLAVLDRLAAPAIFFLVGEQVERDPGLAREIAARGHGIGVHGYRHRNLLRIPPPTLRADLDRAHDVIANATGTVPRLYRPPYGILSLGARLEVRRRGWTPLLWSRWGRDWRRSATGESVHALALEGAGPGDVVLLHDADHYSAPGSWRATVAALDLAASSRSR